MVGIEVACPERVPILRQVEEALAVLLDGCGRRLNPLVRTGWTYAIRRTGGTRIKIGQSSGIIKRMRDIQAANGDPIELVSLCHFTDAENDAHWNHRERRVHGEWFDIDCDPLPMAGDLCYGCAMRRARRSLR